MSGREDVYRRRSPERFIRLALVGDRFQDDMNDEGSKVYLPSRGYPPTRRGAVCTADAADMLTDDIDEARARRPRGRGVTVVLT